MEKQFLINNEYKVSGTLDDAEDWLLENHPEEYFGASIIQVDENNEYIHGGDFTMIASLEYFQEELCIYDEDEIVQEIKMNRM